MKYYAVTEDPNELMHFGIKGMKWGVTRTPEQLGHYKTSKPRRQRSAAYNRAAAKLSRGMQHGIQKAQAQWKEYNSPKNKAIRAYKKNEKRFEKHVELARQGRLKYKGISDAEVKRITDRLALENNARLQSGREKQSFARRMTESVQNGMIEGVGRGTSGYINERMTGRGRTTAEIKGNRRKTRAQYTPAGMVNRAMETHLENKKAVNEVKRQGKKAKYEAQNEVDKEFYKIAAQEGYKTGVAGLIENSRVNVDEFGRVRGVKIGLPSSATKRSRAKAVKAHNDRISSENEVKEAKKKEQETLAELNKQRDSRAAITYGTELGKYQAAQRISELNQARINAGLDPINMPAIKSQNSSSQQTQQSAPKQPKGTTQSRPSAKRPGSNHRPIRKRSTGKRK